MTSPQLKVPTKGHSPNALTKYSLLGSATRLEEIAVQPQPLLGNICSTGEATVWYAKFGTGKTLLTLHLIDQAIQDKRIVAGNVYYVNADDSSAGLACKTRYLEELGVHVVAPGHLGFTSSQLMVVMKEMIDTGTANDVFIILDTLKKFVDVMDKKATRAFTHVIRAFVMKGGTVLALAHTNKRPDSKGKPVPEGTADVLSDFDCAYLLDVSGSLKSTGETVVEFGCVKSRGPSALKAYYAYDADAELSYIERLCSVREADPDQDKFSESPDLRSDEAEVIQGIELSIQHGTATKMDIVRTTARGMRVSQRTALQVLEKYTGDDPEVHRWNYTVREHGRMVYSRLPRDPGAP